MPRHKGQIKTFEQANIDIAAVEQFAELGYTEEQIALVMGVAIRTLRDYKKRYPQFNEIITKGKLKADAVILKSLYEKARGGDVTAQIFWMKNRQPDKWRDRQPGDAKDNPVNLHLKLVDAINQLDRKQLPEKREGE